MLRGVATISFFADDVAAASDWYAAVLGAEPYFRRDAGGTTAYVEFRLGDRETELGIVDRRFARHDAGSARGAVVYWHVDDLDAVLEELQARGASVLEAPTDRGDGFVTAAVTDPFGNVLGVMTNPHYLEHA
ncbi:MAG: VOC family protein [Humibacillus sp.]|nr:VOC family protein [Humibacillus sp.]MDN5780186.1 VOC family protein [Humibacillus sp.]